MAYHLFVMEEARTGRAIHAWLKAADVDARHGLGQAEFTSDREDALAFRDMVAAVTFWRRQSTVAPLRDDGRPNRPLTAFTVQPVHEDAQPVAVRR